MPILQWNYGSLPKKGLKAKAERPTDEELQECLSTYQTEPPRGKMMKDKPSGLPNVHGITRKRRYDDAAKRLFAGYKGR